MRQLSKAVAYYKEKEGRGAMSEAVRQYAWNMQKSMQRNMQRSMVRNRRKRGFFREKIICCNSLVSKGRLKIDVAAEEANVSLGEFEKSMEEAGYKIPELV